MRSIRIILSFCFIFITQEKASSQNSGIGSLLTEGFSLTEMETIMKNVTMKNYKKWMKNNGYKYKEEMNNGYTQVFDKNDIVTLGLFFSPDDKELKHSMFFSSPQKFYKVKDELETTGFKKRKVVKVKNDNNVYVDIITWKKEGYPYAFVSDNKQHFIKISFASAEKDDLGSVVEYEQTPSAKIIVEEVIIGGQSWSLKNANNIYFRNGDLIPEAKTKEEWAAAAANGKPAWCYALNSATNGPLYGKLYNWHAINDKRGIAPKGWHVPSKNEVDVLVKFLGGADIADTKMKTTHTWAKNGGGNNSSGFSAIPGGKRYSTGDFSDFNHGSYFWTTTLGNAPTYAHHFLMQSAGSSVMNQHLALLGSGCSVRFIKD
jgi:uncharacterized protein (TIGR02145 family)